jgi:hypothetical protein
MIKLGKYKHYRGGEYEVLGIAVHSETLEELVMYKMLYDSKDYKKGTVWVRPLKMFTEKVMFNGKEVNRFEYMGN